MVIPAETVARICSAMSLLLPPSTTASTLWGGRPSLSVSLVRFSYTWTAVTPAQLARIADRMLSVMREDRLKILST